MTDKKLTDSQIKKALECCYDLDSSAICHQCPLYQTEECRDGYLGLQAYHLINRQKEEIKEWKRVVETWVEQHEKDKAEIDGLRADLKRVCAERDARICTNNFIKSEAVREFVDRLKEVSSEMIMMCDNGTPISISYSISSKKLDSILKEMVGDKNDR